MKYEEKVVIIHILQLNGSCDFGGGLRCHFHLYLLENEHNDKGFICITCFRELL